MRVNGRLPGRGAIIGFQGRREAEELLRSCYYDGPLLGAVRRYGIGIEWDAVCELPPDARGKALDLRLGRGISALRSWWMAGECLRLDRTRVPFWRRTPFSC